MNYLAERPLGVNGGLLEFPRSVDDLFNRFWGGSSMPRAEVWRPAVEIVDMPQAYLLRAEMPGVTPDDVDVTLTANVITIRGEKKAEARGEDESLCFSERQTGTFERSFTLPTAVSTDDIEAEFRHGVLSVKILKAKEAQPRKVSIRTD